MLWNRYVIGFHGCDANLALDIVSRRKELNYSTNNHDWLGNGIYFWEGSYHRALQWAALESGKKKFKTPGVIGAVIDLGECLNLIEAENQETVRQAYKNLSSLHKVSKVPLPVNSGRNSGARHLDCAVFEFLHQSRNDDNLPPFDTIRAFFIEGSELYPTAGLRHQDHIQVCVRNPASIIGYFLPRTA